MNIAIFSDNFYPELSGITDTLIVLSKKLSARGHAIRLYAPAYSPREFLMTAASAEELSLGANISVHRFYSWPFPSGTKQGRLVVPTWWRWRSLREFAPDIIHSHLFFGVGLEALWAARKLQVPLLGTNHTLLREFIRVRAPFKKPLVALGEAYVTWYYNQCDYVTTPSRRLLADMTKSGLHTPASVMDNPIDLDVFKPVSPERKAKLKQKWNFSDCTVVYAGRLAAEKNCADLIRSITYLKLAIPTVELVIAGHGQSQRELERLVAHLGLGAHIHFLGTLDKANLAEVYAASDLFISASPSENQPLTLLQALAVGLPAVGVEAAGLAEYIKPAYGILAPVGDSEGLAMAAARILKNETKRVTYRHAALTCSQEFQADRIVQKWESLYYSLRH